ncbi:MAG: hypothetical protein ACRD19_14900 [Terriglobia bacterium]
MLLFKGLWSGMVCAAVIAASTLFLCDLQPCIAQDVVQVIYLTPAETARAKQLSQELKEAQNQQRRAKTAWHNFYSNFQAEHPELQHPQITSDFKLALGQGQSGWVDEVIPLTLSAAERKKARSLYRAAHDADADVPRAIQAWQAFQWKLVVDRLPGAKSGADVTLPNGKAALKSTDCNGGEFPTASRPGFQQVTWTAPPHQPLFSHRLFTHGYSCCSPLRGAPRSAFQQPARVVIKSLTRGLASNEPRNPTTTLQGARR